MQLERHPETLRQVGAAKNVVDVPVRQEEVLYLQLVLLHILLDLGVFDRCGRRCVDDHGLALIVRNETAGLEGIKGEAPDFPLLRIDRALIRRSACTSLPLSGSPGDEQTSSHDHAHDAGAVPRLAARDHVSAPDAVPDEVPAGYRG